LKERYPDLRVLVLRVHDEPAVVSLILDAGASGYVLKRTAATDLLPAVEVALRGGSYVSPRSPSGRRHGEMRSKRPDEKAADVP
jgi:DNA-binding NarL/FixJ family response regulator